MAALRAAATQLGKPYVWGAEGPSSYDCSGLTSWAFARAGVTLPRSSSQQALVGTPVSWNNLQPGDLVFYYHPVSHVGIYAGDGKFINAPESGDVVRYQSLSPLGLLRRPSAVGRHRPRPLPRGQAAADPARSAAALARRSVGSVRTVARTLLVTNDFPPRTGGIQRYLLELADPAPGRRARRLRTRVARLRRLRRPACPSRCTAIRPR